MIPIRYLILYILIFPLLVSCGGSSSYPTTSSSNSGSGGSSPTITTLSITGYDSCQYYGLSVGSSATSCDNHGSSSADIALSDLRNGDGKTINADSTLSGSSSSGFAGANNVMQIAEARSLLNDLTLDDDGSNVTVAILGSGFNKPAGSLKSGGTTNNYGYLNADDNIEDYSITTTDGSGNIIIDSNSLLSSIGNDGYSIYNKNTLEAFSPSQNYTAGGTTGITYDDDNAVFRTSKAKAVTTGITTNAVSYIYDIVSTDTTVDSINSHITGLESYYTPKQGSFQSGTLDYAGLTADSTSTFCSDDDCARNYHSFLSEDWDTDFYEYQSSIFEYGHNDVANGTALASIIGISSDSNIAGAASDTVINAYKTQIYHRKLLDVSSGSYIAQESGNYMDSIIEDNTGSIIYDALNAAQLNNEIVLLNNQYRNYKTQFYLNTSITETDFSVGYVNTTDPTQLDEFEEFEIYRFNTNVNYNMSTSDSVYEDYLIGSFVAGNFISTDTLNQSDGSSLSYLVSLDELEIYGSIYGNSGTYKYLTDSSVAAAYSANIANIDNLLKSTTGDGGDNIYVIPTDNQFFIERVNAIGAANTNDDNTIVTVADVKINSITYDGSVDTVDTDGDGDPDYDGLYKIDTITLDSTSPKISVNDCSVVTNGAACFIAPGNVASYNSNGIYTNYNALDVDGTNNNAPDPNSGNATGGATDGMDQGEYLGSAYVTSALAIITSAWKDDIDAGSVTMTNIVEKLVDTATLPANITGCIITVGGSTTGSVDCGSGMINLFAAVEASFVAYNTTSLLPNHSAPVIYSTSSAFDYAYDLSDSSLTTSLYLGDALTLNAGSILSKAKYYDSFNFSYNANLASKISSEDDITSSRYAILDFFEFDDDVVTKSEIVPISDNLSFAITSTKANDSENEFNKQRIFQDPESENTKAEFSNIKFNQDITKSSSISFGFDSYDQEFNVISSHYSNFGSMSFASDNEYASLLGNDSSYSSINLNLSNKLSTNIGFATSSENDTDYIYSKLHYDLGKSYISFSLGTLMESDNFLGTESEGAFNFDGGTNTTYYGLGYVKSLANNIDFISKLDFGISDIKSDSYSIFKDFSNVISREASFALVKRQNNTSYGMAYTEPMRITSGDVLISVSTGRNLNGGVTLASERVSLESSGKERNYELFFKQNLENKDSITLNYIYSSEPNHIASNPDEQLFALKYSKAF